VVTLTENALQANPDIKGFFGSNASNPIASRAPWPTPARQARSPSSGWTTCPRAVDFVCDGTITVLKAQRQWDIGYWAVRYMVAMNENHTIPWDYNTGSRFITKDDCTS
jgi:ribose transport system substrate-binding protein